MLPYLLNYKKKKTAISNWDIHLLRIPYVTLQTPIMLFCSVKGALILRYGCQPFVDGFWYIYIIEKNYLSRCKNLKTCRT